MLKVILVISALLAVAGCEKPNPSPELSDPIYLDIQKQLQASQAQAASDQKALDAATVDFEKVTPQTGQIKYAQKRLYEAQARLQRSKQMVQYYEFRLKSRLEYAKESYGKAYNKKQPWPNPAEYKQYQTQLRLDNAPKQWSVKQRMVEAGLPVGIKNPAQKPAEHGAESAPPAH